MVEGEQQNQRATADALLLFAKTKKRKRQTTTEENRGENEGKRKKVLSTSYNPLLWQQQQKKQKTNKKKGVMNQKMVTRTKSESSGSSVESADIVLPPLVSHIKCLKHFLFPLVDSNLFGDTEKYEFLPVSPAWKSEGWVVNGRKAVSLSIAYLGQRVKW